jgi:hypothetical protein
MFLNGTLLPNFGAFLIFFNAGGGRHWHSFLGRRHLRQFMIAVDIYSEMLVNDIERGFYPLVAAIRMVFVHGLYLIGAT